MSEEFVDATPARKWRPASVGRYRILCELGEGATARVLLARVDGLGGFNRLFAVKMIHENLSAQQKFVDLFLNEARIASKIHHPNVAAISDVGIEEGRYYLSMDYVSGETLMLLLMNTWNKGRPFPIELAAQIVAQACEGLHAAHELKDRDGSPLRVIHRDVAPQNIMIGYDGVVRLMDFGIAKAIDQLNVTRPGVWRGTMPYMAPEQINDQQRMDRRVDIFALGIVLWETTVGQRLFKTTKDLDTIDRVLNLEIPRPTVVVRDYPPALEAIIMKALERDPDKRFQTARDLGDALRDFLVEGGHRLSPSHLERFMKELFADRFRDRLEMERLASAEQSPAVDENALRLITQELKILATAEAEGAHTGEGSESFRSKSGENTLEELDGDEPASVPTKLDRHPQAAVPQAVMDDDEGDTAELPELDLGDESRELRRAALQGSAALPRMGSAAFDKTAKMDTQRDEPPASSRSLWIGLTFVLLVAGVLTWSVWPEASEEPSTPPTATVAEVPPPEEPSKPDGADLPEPIEEPTPKPIVPETEVAPPKQQAEPAEVIDAPPSAPAVRAQPTTIEPASDKPPSKPKRRRRRRSTSPRVESPPPPSTRSAPAKKPPPKLIVDGDDL